MMKSCSHAQGGITHRFLHCLDGCIFPNYDGNSWTPGLLCFKEKQVSSMLDLLVSRLTVCSCFAQLFKCRQKTKALFDMAVDAVVGDDSILFWTDRWFNGGTPAELAPNSKLYQKG